MNSIVATSRNIIIAQAKTDRRKLMRNPFGTNVSREVSEEIQEELIMELQDGRNSERTHI